VAGGFQLSARSVFRAASRVAARFILALMSSAAAEAMLATWPGVLGWRWGAFPFQYEGDKEKRGDLSA